MAQSGSFILIAAFICIPGLYSAAVWAIDVARCPDGGCDADVADETSLLQRLHRLDGTTTITTAFALPAPPPQKLPAVPAPQPPPELEAAAALEAPARRGGGVATAGRGCLSTTRLVASD